MREIYNITEPKSAGIIPIERAVCTFVDSLYLQSNDNNPINKINIENNDEKKKSENSNTNDEIDYYKKKCEEFQMLLNVLKEGIKNIL